MSLMDDFIRWANKYWSDGIRTVEKEHEGDEEAARAARRQVLLDSFYLLRGRDAAHAPGGSDGR